MSAEPLPGRMPDFLIIGAQRSSTTLLHHCLLDHPLIFMPPEEIPFFEEGELDEPRLREFQALFSEASPGQVLGVKRPAYLGLPDCARRIHEFVPEAKLVAVLRDPVERAVAAYCHYVRTGFVPCVPVEEGLRELLAGRWQPRYPRSSEILDFGFYGRQLRLYQEFFRPEQILVLYHEEMREETLETIQRSYRFLGVDDGFVPPGLEGDFQRGIYSLPRLRLRTWSNRFRYSYDESGMRLVSKDRTRLDRLAIEFFDALERSLLPDTPERPPALSESLRKELVGLYASDVDVLRGLDNVPPPRWPAFTEDSAARMAQTPPAPTRDATPTRHVIPWLLSRLVLALALWPLRILLWLQYRTRKRLGLLDLRTRWFGGRFARS